jgi:hypothetical protein
MAEPEGGSPLISEKRTSGLLDSFNEPSQKNGVAWPDSRTALLRVSARGIVLTKLCSYRTLVGSCSDRIEFVIDCRRRKDRDENVLAIKFAA